MFISFSQKLKSLGNVRVGYRLKGSKAIIFICVYWFMNFCWYLLLGGLWCIYGMCYLFFYLPFKGIVTLIKYISEEVKKQKQINEASKKYERPNNENSHQE